MNLFIIHKYSAFCKVLYHVHFIHVTKGFKRVVAPFEFTHRSFLGSPSNPTPLKHPFYG